MQKHIFAFVSLTMHDRAISSKFSIHSKTHASLWVDIMHANVSYF